MSRGPAYIGETHELCHWALRQLNADSQYKLDQVGFLTQVDWKPPFYTRTNKFGAETAYNLLTDNGRKLNLDVTHKISKWK